MIYLMSDVHGQGDAFFTLLDKIRFSGDDRLVIVGDLIAKGRDSLSLLRFVMQHENILLLKGNHDYWWTTTRKMENFLQTSGFDSLHILHNNTSQCNFIIGAYA